MRKSPIKHRVKSHIRKRRQVRSYLRGHGQLRFKGIGQKRTLLTSRFGVRGLEELPLEQNFYIVTGLAEPSNEDSRFQGRVIAKTPQKAKEIIKIVLQEEFDIPNFYNIEVLTKANINRGIQLGIAKNWFEVTTSAPLYYIDKKTGLVTEFHQGISYGGIETRGIGYKEQKTFSGNNPKELRIGIKMEMEHTTDPKEAERIAKEHLAEIPDYYTRLTKLKEDAKKEGQTRITQYRTYRNATQPDLWVSTSEEVVVSLSTRNRHIMRILKLEGATSVNELSRRIGITPKTVLVELNYLKQKNLVKPV